MTTRGPADLFVLFALALVAACHGGGPAGGGNDGGLLPSGIPDCPSSAIAFVISSGTLKAFEDPNTTPLIARVRLGEVVDLFTYPRVSAGGCNSAFGPVQSWVSSNTAVADVAPLSPGSEFATMTGLGVGDATISADVLYPWQPPAGTSKTLFRAHLMYYCCPPATCPAAPPICTYTPIGRVRVVGR